MFYPNYYPWYDYPYRRYDSYRYPYFNPYSPAYVNLINSQVASSNQSIYNAGVMAGVSQVANAINFGPRW